MNGFGKKMIVAVFGIMLLAGSTLSGVSAQEVSVSLPNFKITMNDVRIDNAERLYPIIVYRDITYVPMTYNDSRFLGLETKWESASGLEVNKISEQKSYNPNRGYASSYLESAILPNFRIRVNGKEINNQSETYPLLVFRDITYFPLTWRYMVDEFGWKSSFDNTEGLVISSTPSTTAPIATTPTPTERIYTREFGNLSVIFDRVSNQQSGNLSIRENNRLRRIGSPRYIYGVGYSQSGAYGEYSPLDKVEYANRWIYTVAIDPNTSPIRSRNVRINIDTNEVQMIDDGMIGDPDSMNQQVYSRQFGRTTVMLDRASNQQQGNLSIRESNRTRKIGNPNYIYGVEYNQQGRRATYTPVDNLNLTNRWVYTLAIDPNSSPIRSRNVRINIDTNEVQMLDDGMIGDPGPINQQVYSRQFGNTLVMLNRVSNQQPGNLSVRENNRTRKIGNPNYIYGVAYTLRGRIGTYTPVDTLSLTNRWVYTVAIDPHASPVTSRNVRVNIDTNEVQIVR
ncbi:MAG: hypothetical protein AB9917_08275 [Negativicutes bacterium]